MPSEAPFKYRAFISYSRNDREVAKKLQRLLEYYVLPEALRVVSAGVKREARPLAPCFRDEDELVPGQDLPDRIRQGLEASEYLVVVCSKSAVASEWVEKEILDFCRLGRQQNILAVVIDGEPNAREGSEEALPRALRFQTDAAGNLTEQPAEPLWIDWRENARSDRVMFLRIVAALLSLRSLDELIRRDAQARRRAKIIRISLTAAAVLLFSAVGFAWFRERDSSEVQAIQQALSLSRADFADNRVDSGLQRLQPFLDGRHADLVEPVIRNVLGWAVPIRQQFEHLPVPALLRYRGALLLLDQNRTLHDLSGIDPQRIILSQDGRRLVLIQNTQVAVYDAITGARLGQTDSFSMSWNSNAFETPDGLLVVLGTFMGSTNATVHYDALSVSKSGSAVNQTFLSPILALRGIAVAGSCQGLLLSHDPAYAELNANESLRFSAETIEPAQAIVRQAQESFSSGEPTDAFSDLLQQDFPDSGLTHPHHDVTSSQPFEAVSSSLNPFVQAGCTQVKSDSEQLHAQGITNPLSDPTALSAGSDFEPADHWSQASTSVPAKTVISLCPQSAPCPVVDGRGEGVTHTQGDQEVNAFMDDSYGPPPAPRDAAAFATEFDSFDGSPILFEYHHFNAGTELAICRAIDGRPRCYEETVLGDEKRTDNFIRSHTGRYLFWEMGGAVIDLKTLHKVTNLREIPGEQSQACDFTSDDSQFVCAANGRLAFYQAVSSSPLWSQSTTSPSIGPLQLDSGQKIAGILALPGNEFISARSDGQVGRFDASGNARWQLNLVGIGRLSDLQPSPNGQFILVIGERGLRILSGDGFVQSGPLAPPVVLTGKRPLGTCLQRSTTVKPYIGIDDAGSLRVMCGEDAPASLTMFVHTPRPAEGAVNDSLKGGICTPPTNLSPIEALKVCSQ